MREKETDRVGMAYQSLVDLPFNRSRSSPLSYLGFGIPSKGVSVRRLENVCSAG